MGSGGADQAGVDAEVALGVEIHAGERGVGQFGDGVADPAREHVVRGLILLEHQPCAADDVPGEGPVAHRLQRAERELILQAECDRGRTPW